MYEKRRNIHNPASLDPKYKKVSLFSARVFLRSRHTIDSQFS